MTSRTGRGSDPVRGRCSGADPTPDGRVTVEPPGRGCHLRSGPVRWPRGGLPDPSTPLFLTVFEGRERSSSNNRGCGMWGHPPSGLLRPRGGLWMDRGRICGPPVLPVDGSAGARVVHGSVHGLSTVSARFIHGPAAGNPQGCPQVWVERVPPGRGERPVGDRRRLSAASSVIHARARSATRTPTTGDGADHRDGSRCVERRHLDDERARVAHPGKIVSW